MQKYKKSTRKQAEGSFKKYLKYLEYLNYLKLLPLDHNPGTPNPQIIYTE